MNKQLMVALDTTAETGDAEVIVIPKHLALPQGQSSLTWTQITNEPFTFVSLTPTNLFSNIVIGAQQISAQYNNQKSGAEFKYTIAVADTNGHQHTTDPTVAKRAKTAKGAKGAKGGPIGNGGGPTIKNN
jgi:hypothetical protein